MNMSLFINSIRLLEYEARNESRKYEAKAVMREKLLLLEAERSFSPVEIYSSNQGFLGENSLKDTSRKGRPRNERDKSSAQDVT